MRVSFTVITTTFVTTFLALTSGVLSAQDKDATFSTDVKVVNVFATVRDKQGKVVNNLTKQDFTVQENGVSQPITYFSRETDQPLSIGLLVDTSNSQRRVLGEEKTASYAFDFETELLQDLTASREDLRRALDLLELPAGQQPQMRGSQGGGGKNGGGQQRSGIPGIGGGIGFPGGGIGFPGGRGGGRGGAGRGGGRGGQGPGRGGGAVAGTTLYDAVFLASDEVLRKQSGRKALILLTDGMDMGSKTSLSSAIESAQRADTMVYSILFSDQQSYGGRGGRSGAEVKRVLQRLAQETGGSFYEVTGKLTLDQIYARLQEELRNQYSLGYAPDTTQASAASSSFRSIKVTVKQRDMIVQAREGYYPIR